MALDRNSGGSGTGSSSAAIDHDLIQNNGTNDHDAIDTHIADSTIHLTAAEVDHGSIAGLSDDDHSQYALADQSRGFNHAGDGSDTISIGSGATALQTAAISLGINSDASDLHTISIGNGTQAYETDGIAIGRNAAAGQSAGNNTETAAISIGYQSYAYESYGISIGNASKTGNFGSSGAPDGIAIGRSADATADDAIAIGAVTLAQGSGQIAIGAAADAGTTGTSNGIAIGNGAAAGGNNSVAIGQAVNNINANTVEIGVDNTNKMVYNATKDLSGINDLTITGAFSDGNYTFDTSGNVSGLGTVGCGALTCTTFTSTGIDDNATAERLQIADTLSGFTGSTTGEVRATAGNGTATLRAIASGTNNSFFYLSNGSGEQLRITAQNTGQITFGHTTGNSTWLVVDVNGNPNFTGTATFDAGEGCVFNGDAIAAANTLDDYEEGTWTPVLSDGSNNATMSASTYGTYLKVGNRVFISARVITTALGSVSGGIRITGLPFTSNGTSNNLNSCSCGRGAGLAITAGYTPTAQIGNSVSHINLNMWDATTGTTSMQDTEWTADGDITISGEYHV